MPVCATCHDQWTFRQTLRAMYTLKPTMTCPNCGREQHLTSASRKRGAAMPFLILIPMLIRVFIGLSMPVIIGGMLLMAAIFHLIYPQLIKLTDKEEPLW